MDGIGCPEVIGVIATLRIDDNISIILDGQIGTRVIVCPRTPERFIKDRIAGEGRNERQQQRSSRSVLYSRWLHARS
jgi:hypothetical protein